MLAAQVAHRKGSESLECCSSRTDLGGSNDIFIVRISLGSSFGSGDAAKDILRYFRQCPVEGKKIGNSSVSLPICLWGSALTIF